MKKMKTLAILTLSTLVASSLSAATPKQLSKEELKKIVESSVIFSNKNIEVTKGYDRSEYNLYQLETLFKTQRGVSKIPAFMDKKTHVIFVGSAYGPDGKTISMPVNKESITPGVAFTYGSGEKGELYLFTDPECPFCKRLETMAGEKLNGYKVHVVLFPLSFHKTAKPITQWILRGKTEAEKAERMKKAMNGSEEWRKDLGFSKDPKKYQNEYREYLSVLNGTNDPKLVKKYFKDQAEIDAFKDYLKKSDKAFKEVGARGTPTLKDGNFKTVNPVKL
jgi:thiol:disulfide interchange protein DsbC